MEELKPQRKETNLPQNNQVTTTLIIKDVPSNIAYKKVMEGIISGNWTTKEDIQYAINVGLGEIKPEQKPAETLNNMERTETHNAEWHKVDGDSEITEVCRCKDCGAILAHRIRKETGEQLFVDFERVSPMFELDEERLYQNHVAHHNEEEYGNQVEDHHKEYIPNIQYYSETPTPPPEQGNNSGGRSR